MGRRDPTAGLRRPPVFEYPILLFFTSMSRWFSSFGLSMGGLSMSQGNVTVHVQVAVDVDSVL